MTLDDIKAIVECINEMSGDYEAAHAEEDNLYFELIKMISMGQQVTQEMAIEALKTKEISFPRYTS